MKQYVTAIFLFCSSVCFSQSDTLHSNKGNAIANQLNGIYVFMYSEPIAKYKVLGEITVVQDDYEGLKDYATEKAKKKFPTAEGVTFYRRKSDNIIVISVIQFLE